MVMYYSLEETEEPGGNVLFLTPAAAQGAVISVKLLLLIETKQFAFQLSEEMSN